MKKGLQPGKVPIFTLSKYLERFNKNLPKEVIIGPKAGEDAALVRFGDRFFVVTSDPITFTTKESGYYLVVVNSNDIAAMGATPKYLLVNLLLPERKTDESLLDEIMNQIYESAKKFDIHIIGGHTEVTPGLDRIILVGTMIGELIGDRPFSSSDAREGDLLLMTKKVAIEGTSIIAREKEEELLENFPSEIIERSKNFIFSPGISILEEAIIAGKSGLIRAMHDPTEGGIITGIYEMAIASDLGVEVEIEKIPIYEETKIFSAFYGIDPYGLIASGTLLLSAPQENLTELLTLFDKEGIELTEIGRFLKKEEGMKIKAKGKSSELKPFLRDEITKIF